MQGCGCGPQWYLPYSYRGYEEKGYVYKHEIFHERNITMKIIELIRKIIFENVFMNAFFQMFYENVGC